MICDICEFGCRVPEGATGACGMYFASGGAMREVFPDRYLLICPVSVETMPLLHFHPGGKFLQISTTGCNLACPGCISNLVVRGMRAQNTWLHLRAPETVVDEAHRNGCRGITFLMNDPLASLPTFLGVARRARERGLLVGCASNAYFTPASLGRLMPLLDFISVGFKGFSDRSYAACGAKGVEPVLRNVKALVAAGVHVEAACMHKAGNEPELVALAGFLAGVSPAIPLHVMRFLPLENTDIALEPSIRQSERLCDQLRRSLPYVYLFNSPGTRYLDTVCSGCGTVLYTREFYGPMGARLLGWAAADGVCPACGTPHPVRGEAAAAAFREGAFEGGYPFTRALEIIDAILIALGVAGEGDFVAVLGQILRHFTLRELHRGIQDPWAYLEIVRTFGRLAGREKQADLLTGYIGERLSRVARGLTDAGDRPLAYYVMGKPLFCLNGERMENALVEYAGGTSVNKLMEGSGRPGFGISVETLNRLNPRFIFISSFFSNPLEDFYEDCRGLGIDVEAVRTGRVHTHLLPVCDFGSPRWILGLMYIANVLHPEVFHFDVMKEAEEFYRRFYGSKFRLEKVNRSFGRPLSGWRRTGKKGDRRNADNGYAVFRHPGESGR